MTLPRVGFIPANFVSQKTISRVIGSHPHIDEKTAAPIAGEVFTISGIENSDTRKVHFVRHAFTALHVHVP